jgi:CRISPR system Cascade subunit CasA
MNVLQDAVVGASLDEAECRLTLPGVFAALMADRISGFPALRAHQRHAWHAFLSQLGAIALHAAGMADPPTDEAAWRDLLRRLTPDDPNDDAWSLVTPFDRPALLQPPVPDGLAGLKKPIATPDGLDMLVTARNHDFKQAVMTVAQPDDWLFALVTLQTMQGVYGAGKYGISRMNGGYANRAGLGIVPPGGLGTRVRRDILRLHAERRKIAEQYGYDVDHGIALVWCMPWDGTTSLDVATLDPLYIEICRRVRLNRANGIIRARSGTSVVPRIVRTKGGLTGDPWAPTQTEKDGSAKVVTVTDGFGYRHIVELMFPTNGRPALMQQPTDNDAVEGLSLVARALVRGEGGTEGYHERHVLLSRRVRQMLGGSRATDPVADAAHERVTLAGEVQYRVLRPALLALFQNGPERIDLRHDASARKADPFLATFDRVVDRDFFPCLWEELEADEPDTGRARRTAWVRDMLGYVRAIVDEAEHAAPKSVHRRYRARARALQELALAPRRSTLLADLIGEKTHDDAA